MTYLYLHPEISFPVLFHSCERKDSNGNMEGSSTKVYWGLASQIDFEENGRPLVDELNGDANNMER